MTASGAGRKRRDDELLCECGHLYHAHERRYDDQKQQFEFAHNGPCGLCDDCEYYKEESR